MHIGYILNSLLLGSVVLSAIARNYSRYDEQYVPPENAKLENELPRLRSREKATNVTRERDDDESGTQLGAER